MMFNPSLDHLLMSIFNTKALLLLKKRKKELLVLIDLPHNFHAMVKYSRNARITPT